MGELLCNENTAALLASYIVQSDCGDFAAEDYPDDSYLSSARFIPNQSAEFQRKVMENHMKLMYVCLNIQNFFEFINKFNFLTDQNFRKKNENFKFYINFYLSYILYLSVREIRLNSFIRYRKSNNTISKL